MDYSAYSVLSSEQKERIRAFVGFCNAQDHLHNEIYLGSEFKAYPEMKVFYLAQEGSEIVGFLMVYADDRESAEISACVLSSRRREGIFSALFQQAGMELKKYHYSKVLLKTEKAFEDQQAFLSHYPVSFSHSEFLMVFDASGCRPCAPKEGFSLRLAREALRAGPYAMIALNGANEAAVAAFLENRIPFGAIANIVEQILASMPPARISCVEDVYRMDRGARSRANVEIGRME